MEALPAPRVEFQVVIPTPEALAFWRRQLGFANAHNFDHGQNLGDKAGKIAGWFANALLLSLLTLLYSSFLLGMSWTAISLSTS